MSQKIIQFYPAVEQEVHLEGLYLKHDIRELAGRQKRPFVYANYVTSVDGRISIPHPDGDDQKEPDAIANERDWRLFQELAAQADIILSNKQYVQRLAASKPHDLFEVNNEKYADLARWRQELGLNPHPDVAVVSRSLDFPIPESLDEDGRRLLIFTVEEAPQSKIEALRAMSIQVFVVGKYSVDAQQMVGKMEQLGYQAIYNGTGPRVNHLLLKGGVLDRLYLTLANRMVGGDPFLAMVEGEVFDTAVNLKLNTLYLDPTALRGSGQQFFSFDTR